MQQTRVPIYTASVSDTGRSQPVTYSYRWCFCALPPFCISTHPPRAVRGVQHTKMTFVHSTIRNVNYHRPLDDNLVRVCMCICARTNRYVVLAMQRGRYQYLSSVHHHTERTKDFGIITNNWAIVVSSSLFVWLSAHLFWTNIYLYSEINCHFIINRIALYVLVSLCVG